MACKKKKIKEGWKSQQRKQSDFWSFSEVGEEMMWMKEFIFPRVIDNIYDALEKESERKELDECMCQLDESLDAFQVYMAIVPCLQKMGKSEERVEWIVKQTMFDFMGLMEEITEKKGEMMREDQGSFADLENE